MKEIERIGLLKMDFLGLSTLTLLNDAVEEIRAHDRRGARSRRDSARRPEDLSDLLPTAQTYGIFQFESSGMRDILRKAKPQRLDDLIALNALYRPGPLRSGMVDDFIARKHGKVKVTYEVPELEPILADTYGVIAYQEQVMRIASVLAGFTLGEADLLRKAMGKKKADVMQAQRQKFVDGAVGARASARRRPTKIFDLMEHFAGYGFNKSHSTAYALLAYQTAYLKANYPWHFAAALLTIEAQNTDKLAMYLAECRDRGIPVLPPDINKSQLAFTVTPEGVRFGLTAVKNVGEGAIASILGVRAAQGTITSLHALVRRARSAPRQQARAREPGEGGRVRFARRRGQRARRSASVARAADGDDRSRVRARRAPAARPRAAARRSCSAARRQTAEARTSRRAGRPSDVEPWTEVQQLAYEKEALGLYLSGHPIDRVAAELERSARRRRPSWRTAASRRSTASRATARRPTARTGIGERGCGRGGRRHHRGHPPAEDAQGRSHGRDHAGRSARQRRGRGLSRGVRESGGVLETGAMVVVKGKVELRRRDRPHDGERGAAHRDDAAEDVARAVDQADARRRTAGRRSRRWPTCSREHRGDRRVVLELELRDQQPPLRLRAAWPRQVPRASVRAAGVRSRKRICGAGTVVRNR